MAAAPVTDAGGFNARVSASPFSGFLQSFEWGEFKRRFGWGVERFETGDTVGSILTKHLPLSQSFSYLPWGPASDFSNAQELRDVFSLLRERAEQTRAVFVRVDPLLPAGRESLLTKHGFVKSFEEVQPKDSLWLDLRPPAWELLRAMHQKGRYNIRLAERKGVTVTEDATADGLAVFYALHAETARRERITLRPLEYFRAMKDCLSGMIKVFIARYNGVPLAGLFVVVFGDRATYLYGGSSSQHREIMAPYAAHWAAIKAVQAEGATVYDFGGVSPADVPSHPWAGSSRFKRQFGAEEKHFIGAYDLVINRKLYTLYRHAERLRRLVLKAAP